jgi:hypothetical protein
LNQGKSYNLAKLENHLVSIGASREANRLEAFRQLVLNPALIFSDIGFNMVPDDKRIGLNSVKLCF